MEKQQLLNIVRETVAEILANNTYQDYQEIPVGVSNRHIHLSQKAVDRLFGVGYSLTRLKELSQPGQFVCQEVVTVIGPKGKIRNVRLLGPVRENTQLEISVSDGFVLGIKPPVRHSGDTVGTPGFTLQGPKGQLKIANGLICAARHIHMHPDDAKRFGVKDGDVVDIHIPGERSVIFEKTLIRVSPKSRLEMHIDFDEANAASIKNGQSGFLSRTKLGLDE